MTYKLQVGPRCSGERCQERAGKGKVLRCFWAYSRTEEDSWCRSQSCENCEVSVAIVGCESGDGAVVESGHLEAIFRSSAIVVTLQKPGWRQVDKALRGGLVAGQCWHRLIGEAEQGTHLHRRRYMYYEAASRITSVQGPILTSTATVGGSITCHRRLLHARGQQNHSRKTTFYYLPHGEWAILVLGPQSVTHGEYQTIGMNTIP